MAPPSEARSRSLPTKVTQPKSAAERPASKVHSSTATDRSRAASAPSYPPQTLAETTSRSKPLDSKINGHHSPIRNQNERPPSSVVRFQANDGTRDNGNDMACSTDDLENELITEGEEEVIEEPESIVVEEILDAKCLLYGSTITIRSQANIRSCMSVSRKTRGDTARYLATMSGGSLIRDGQVFQVTRGDVTDADKDIVRYGDIIALRSVFAQDRTLGVRKLSTNEISGVSYELGFFRSTASSAEKWTIVRGGRVVLVGSAALKKKASNAKGKTAAVRSGDPLLLRNNLTGGLLALDSIDDDTLTLVTDSYDSDIIRTGFSSDALPLSRIQHHHHILPSTKETFQFVHSQVPSCPQWTYDASRRIYENMSYLLNTERNDRDEAIYLKLFGHSLRDGRKSLQTPLKSGGVITQEKILLDEVIGSFVGLEGQYVKFCGKDMSDEESRFFISEPHGVSFDTSLKNLVNHILPLSTALVHVRSFVSSHRPGYEYGFVVQAACESLEALLQEHLTFAAKMEQLLRQSGAIDTMTMNKLHVYVQSPLRRMTAMEQVAIAIRERKGGSFLNCLHELKTRVFAGNDIVQNDLETLLQKASVPYFKMMETWLQSGVFHDPFDEFMIEMSERPIDQSINAPVLFGGYDGDAWNDMFRIQSYHVLESVLSSPAVQQQVLLTGKYWNAVQLCPRTSTEGTNERSSPKDKFATHLHYGMDAIAISTYVHSMYRSASHQLRQLLVGDFDMMETLLTMKRYFLVHQGDFLVHLFDAAEDELLQELTEVSRGRVQHWLAMCVQLTEPYTDDSSSKLSSVGVGRPAGPLMAQMLRCSFAPESLLDHLDALHAESGGIDAHEPKTPSRHPYGMTNKGITGVEAFTLQFDRIPFPTSLIISQHALSSYQLLFRHLFFAKHVERRLVGIWLDHQTMKQFQSLRRAMGPTYCLRQRMLHFMQNFIYYMMFEVIEPNWLEMEKAIRNQQSSRNIQTVDDIVKVHNQFLDLALAECLLTNRELIRILTKLMSTCLLFSEQLKRFMEATKIVRSEEFILHLMHEYVLAKPLILVCLLLTTGGREPDGC